MKHLLFALIILLSVSACTTTDTSSTKPVNTPASKQAEPPLEQRIYYYQHRLIPKWTFGSDGAFFRDIMNGSIGQLKAAAADLISSEYADNISIKPLSEHNGILITFQEPSSVPHCYFIFIRKIDDKFMFLTYEKTRDISNEGYIGVVGGWSPDGVHSNYGPRKYSDADSFIADAVGIN